MNEKTKKAALFASVIGATAAGIVLFFCDPSRVPIYPVCPFHRLTGLDCPGCGSLRALHQLAHGNLVAALHYNLFLVTSLPVFTWLALRFVKSEILGRPVNPIRTLWLWTYLLAWLAFGILRDLPIPLAASFAP